MLRLGTRLAVSSQTCAGFMRALGDETRLRILMVCNRVAPHVRRAVGAVRGVISISGVAA